MSLDALSPEEIEQKQQELLNAVPDAKSIGNKTLKEVLGRAWSDDLYWEIRNRLIERGILELGRGKGGSVKRVIYQQTETDNISNSNAQSPSSSDTFKSYEKELSLYEPIAMVLRNKWLKEQGFDSHLVEITAKGGSKQTGGKWTRPDITAIGYKTFPYVPGRFLEVITFEIKPTSTTDVSAVYEALAHRRAATRAYVISHIPEASLAEYQQIIDAISDEAKKFGVGFILANDPSDFDTWETLLEAERFEPDPARLNEFIAQQASPEMKDQIVRWFK
jgi:hypothetical protein